MRPVRTHPILATLGSLALWAFAALFVQSSGRVARAADPEPADRGERVRSAIATLGSPYLGEREDAVADLIQLGPAARAAVLQAFGSAPPDSRVLLVRVMAADGSAEALDTLLTTLEKADPHTSRAIEKALIDHAEALATRVAAWREAKDVSPRISELLSLLRRARIEKAFLSRKSRSGGTGYYHGQFDVLKPERAEAVKVCLAIFSDSPVRLPGEFPAGGFRFLREPPFFVDPEDLRLMAGNALAELMEEGDGRELDELERLYGRLKMLTLRERFRRGSTPDDGYLDVALSILCRVRGGEYLDEARMRVRSLKQMANREGAAMLLLRLGQFDDAIQIYRDLIDEGDVSAIPYYNIACAYCSWAIDAKTDPADKPKHLSRAMASLTKAVDAGYPDWPWMEQDRDLDPIRGMPEYKALLVRVKDRMRVPFRPGSGDSPLPPPYVPPPMDDSGEGPPPMDGSGDVPPPVAPPPAPRGDR